MNNKAIQNGLFMGAASIVLTLVFYFVSPKAMLQYGSWALYIVFLFFMYKAAVDERGALGGLISFGDALKAAFLAYVVGGLIYYLFNHVLMTLIDPSLIDLTKDIALDSMDKMNSFLDEDQVDKMKEAIDEQEFAPTIGSTLLGYLVSLIVGFIFALIIAAITKRADTNSFA